MTQFLDDAATSQRRVKPRAGVIFVSYTEFRWRGKRFHLTYPTWLPVEQVKEFIEEKLQRQVNKIRAAWERSDQEAEYDHTHICFELDRSADAQGERLMDFGEPAQHPHVVTINNNHQFQNTWDYVWKMQPVLFFSDNRMTN